MICDMWCLETLKKLNDEEVARRERASQSATGRSPVAREQEEDDPASGGLRRPVTLAEFERCKASETFAGRVAQSFEADNTTA